MKTTQKRSIYSAKKEVLHFPMTTAAEWRGGRQCWWVVHTAAPHTGAQGPGVGAGSQPGPFLQEVWGCRWTDEGATSSLAGSSEPMTAGSVPGGRGTSWLFPFHSSYRHFWGQESAANVSARPDF